MKTPVQLTGTPRSARGLLCSLVTATLLFVCISARAQVDTTTAVTSSANPVGYHQNLTLTATVAGSGPTGNVKFVADPSYGKRVAILPLEGANNGTAVNGLEWPPKVWTASGNAKISTVTGVSSLALDGAGDYVSTSSNLADFVFGTGDFEIRFRMKSSVPAKAVIDFYPGWQVYINGSGKLEWWESGLRKGGGITVTDGAWHDIEVTRVAGVLYFYVDGTRDGAGTAYANNLSTQVSAFSIGAQVASRSSSYDFNGMIDDVRVTKGLGGNTGATRVVANDGTMALGTPALVNGQAAVSTDALPAGSSGIFGFYGGDANNAPSHSSFKQTVDGLTSTALTVNPLHAIAGQNVILNARVTGNSPGGTVTFLDGTTVLGTANVTDGVASLSVNTLTAGSHSLGASYSGDATNSSSAAPAVTVSVVAGMIWQYGYDAMGRPNTVANPIGQTTYFHYDKLGRRIQSQQPPNTGSSSPTAIDYGYDLADTLTSVKDPRSLTTSYTPNGLGNVTSQSSPDSGASQFTYDAKGNVLTSTDARGKTTTFTYDVLDRVTNISYPTGTPTIFEYDGGANPTPAVAGELTKMTDESGQTTYSYDSMGRMTGKTVVIAGKTFAVGYAWGDSGSALDKLTAITYPSGSRVNYSYDQYGSVSGITVNPVNANGQGTSGTAVTLLSGIGYNVDHNVTGWLWSDGKARTIGYDSNGLVSSYNLGDPLGTGTAAGLLRAILRDAAGRITGYTHTNNGAAQAGFDQTFGYDNLDRLTSATQAASSTQYSYDATGNRTAKTIGGITYPNTVSPTSNRLNQVQDPTGTATINYDAAGNTVGDGSFTYTYSDRGRMASATTASGTVSYLYDGNGQRVKKSGPAALVASGASHFVYDEAGHLLGEYDADGKPLYETIYLGSMPVGALKQAGTASNSDIAVTLHNVHSDHIDTPRVITKQDQTVVWRWDAAEAFGATAPDQNPSGPGAFAFNQRFPGQVFDAETGLFQNWNREYNARTGRYIEPDPLGLMSQPALASRLSPKLRAKLTKMQSLNHLYSYVDGDPLNKSDPEGLEPGAAMSVAPLAGRGAGALLGGLRGAPGGVVGIALGIGIGVLAEGACEPTDRDRRERQCDADYEAGVKFCHAMAVTKGRHKGTKKYAETYSRCMAPVEEAYVECYQEAGKP